ncbi:hypothetical protein ElyMa_006744100, partial [Elysia marginata]
SAKEFKVQNAGKTCALLSLEGSLQLTATQNEKQIATESLQFSKATLIAGSTCTLIKLNMTSSAEVWFQFDAVQKDFKVTPVSKFVPESVFGKDVNDTEPLDLKAAALEQFPQTGYFKCNSASKLNFIPESETVDYNYTVTATVTNFEIQSADGDAFLKTGSVTVELPVSKDYLKASEGYYICNAKLDKSKDGVTLSSKDFKYRAFDKDSKGFDGNGEFPALFCSGVNVV